MINKKIGVIGSVWGLSTLLSANEIKNMKSVEKEVDEDEKRISLSNLRDLSLKCKKGHSYRKREQNFESLLKVDWVCVNCGRYL